MLKSTPTPTETNRPTNFPTPQTADACGIDSMPADVLFDEGCPKTDDPYDDDHNTQKTRKMAFRGGELVLILHFQCSCGLERRRTIG